MVKHEMELNMKCSCLKFSPWYVFFCFFLQAGQQRGCKELLNWTKDICNHFWHCCKSAETYEEFFVSIHIGCEAKSIKLNWFQFVWIIYLKMLHLFIGTMVRCPAPCNWRARVGSRCLPAWSIARGQGQGVAKKGIRGTLATN